MAQHAFWIIIDGQTPTSFRSRQQEDLLPTLHQLQRKQPQVKLMWFERGRLWASPTEAREALVIGRRTPTGRTRTWRPGGAHVDPRAKYEISRDQKRARFKARLGRDSRPDGSPSTSPPSDPVKPAGDSEGKRTPSLPTSRPAPRPASRPAGGFDRRPPARTRERTDTRSKDRFEAPRPKPEGDRKPKGFGDRPWRPKGPWKPKKPR